MTNATITPEEVTTAIENGLPHRVYDATGHDDLKVIRYVENRSERRKREQAEKAEARRTRRGMNRIERILGGREA